MAAKFVHSEQSQTTFLRYTNNLHMRERGLNAILVISKQRGRRVLSFIFSENTTNWSVWEKLWSLVATYAATKRFLNRV